MDVCAALKALHMIGVVHRLLPVFGCRSFILYIHSQFVNFFLDFRDIKPANIMKLGQGGGETLATATLRRTASNVDGNKVRKQLKTTGGKGFFGLFTRKSDGGSETSSNMNTRDQLTGTMEFVNVANTLSRDMGTVEYVKSSYKLIDLGTAVGIHELEDTPAGDSMMTLSEMAFAG